MNLRYKLMQFMSGRNGPDDLSFLTFAAAIVLSLVNIFVRSSVLQLVVYALVIYALFRMLSRNTSKRYSENRWVREKIDVLRRKNELKAQRQNDKCHVYKKCPNCKAILRLPHRVGVHRTVCPKCGNSFTVKVKK